jgi:preprotein translocase subunit SecY
MSGSSNWTWMNTYVFEPHQRCLPASFYFLLIIAFSYFYSRRCSTTPIEIANNLKKNGGFIPGFRPGRADSSDFIA